jgi:hypothetical protein
VLGQPSKDKDPWFTLQEGLIVSTWPLYRFDARISEMKNDGSSGFATLKLLRLQAASGTSSSRRAPWIEIEAPFAFGL